MSSRSLLRHLSRLFVALLVLVAGSGCGMMRLRGEAVESGSWPLSERIEIGMLPDGKLLFSGSAGKPTALVRISLDHVAEDLEAEREPPLSLKWYGAAFHSGLFSSVTYQYGTDRYSIPTDYVIDLELSEKTEFEWYSYVGGCTLGILPVINHTTYTLTCSLEGKDRQELASLVREDYLTDVWWLPFLPLNIVFNVLDLLSIGTALGLNDRGWDQKRLAVIEGLFRSALREIQERMEAPPGEPEAPPGEAPVDEAPLDEAPGGD